MNFAALKSIGHAFGTDAKAYMTNYQTNLSFSLVGLPAKVLQEHTSVAQETKYMSLSAMICP
jgi:hypothetical protein